MSAYQTKRPWAGRSGGRPAQGTIRALWSGSGEIGRGERNDAPQSGFGVRRQRKRTLERIERITAIRHLLGAIRPRDQAERSWEVLTERRLRHSGDRDPYLGARPGTGRRPALGVMGVGVDHLSVGLGED